MASSNSTINFSVDTWEKCKIIKSSSQSFTTRILLTETQEYKEEITITNSNGNASLIVMIPVEKKYYLWYKAWKELTSSKKD